MTIKNWEVFAKDPRKTTIPNDGVTEVGQPKTPEEWSVLRYELSTFVCEGQYQTGLERILSTYLTNLDRDTQPAVWVSGFYGSGKSHLVRVLEYLWRDLVLPGGASARSLTHLPAEIEDLLTELTTVGKRHGGLWAASGTLGAGAGDSARLAVLGIIFKGAGLPENYAKGRFVLWLKQEGIEDEVRAAVESAGKSFDRELNNMYVSPVLAEAVMAAIPGFANSNQEARATFRQQFPDAKDIDNDEMVELIASVMALQSGDPDNLPCTLLVLDELQQYVADDADKLHKLQVAVQAFSRRFGSRLLVVATGQSALQAHPQLQKMRDRFTVQVELTDTDVEKVVRQVVLRKAPNREADVGSVLNAASGEIDRQLQGTKLASRPEDSAVLTADYPLLPTRRRFWERVLRAIDKAGAAGQLRTQLRTVHEGTRSVADSPLGTVVPGDFIYSQQSASMLETGVLLKDIDETIRNLDDGTYDGVLASRACALIFLIQQLPTDSGSDMGLRPTVDTLADLLVSDLAADGVELRKKLPALLEDLAERGILLKLAGEAGDEYRLQTRESSEWEQAYRTAYSRAMGDAGRVASERAKRLREEVSSALKGISVTQGNSKTPRKVEPYFGIERPPTDGGIRIWIRDEWDVSEKTVRADAQAAGLQDPTVYVHLPRRAPDDLKKALAGYLAASDVLNTKGAVAATTPEALEARQGIQSRHVRQEHEIRRLINEAIDGGRVFLGGGNEISLIGLRAAAQEAASRAAARLYPEFDVADDTRWNRVIERVKQGSGDPLSTLSFSGETKDHPVCSKVLAFITASGKKGSDVRREFDAPPYGWSRDAIDGALLALVAADQLSATINGSPIAVKALDQSKLGVAEFRSQSVVLTAKQRIDLRMLFSKVGVSAKAGEEAAAALAFLKELRALAAAAGGSAPAPAAPSTTNLEAIANLSGNEQLLQLFNTRVDLTASVEAWQGAAREIKRRTPRWEALLKLLDYAKGLSVALEVQEQIDAIQRDRLLLVDPDPVPPLAQRLTDALRHELACAYKDLLNTYRTQMNELSATEAWNKLPIDEAKTLLLKNGLREPETPAIETETQILAALDEYSLASLGDRIAAIPNRKSSALQAAISFFEPRTVHIMAPTHTFRTAEEVDNYLRELRDMIVQHIEEGNPVVITQG